MPVDEQKNSLPGKKFPLFFIFLNNRGLNLRDNQRRTALFQKFDVFQRWFRQHGKHQRWSALFQSWSALIFSEWALFGTNKFSAVSEKTYFESALFSVDFLSSGTLGFQRWTALIYSELVLILLHVDGVARGRGIAIYSLLSCADGWLSQHCCVVATAILYKSQ